MIPTHKIFEITCQITQTTPKEIMANDRIHRTLIPRLVLMYLLYHECGLMTHRVAELLDCSESNIQQRLKTASRAFTERYPTKYQMQLTEFINKARNYIRENEHFLQQTN